MRKSIINKSVGIIQIIPTLLPIRHIFAEKLEGNMNNGRVVWISVTFILFAVGLILWGAVKNPPPSTPGPSTLEIASSPAADGTVIVTETSVPVVESSTTPSETPIIIADTPSITPIPALVVDLDISWKCDSNGKPIYYIKFIPSGGIPDYTYSPSEPFAARPGDFKPAAVKSKDGQTWQANIEIPRHNCRRDNDAQSGEGGSVTTPGVPTVDLPATVVPDCEPRGNSGKCKKK